jgi:long-chain acyl-CoA synthetase
MLCFAGDKTPVQLLHRCLKLTGVIPLIGYGLTESFVVALNLSESTTKFGSMGMPIEGVQVKIVDWQGKPVPPGTTGEIIIQSPQNTAGYLHEPHETTRAFFAENWFRTGDLAYFDEDGFLWFVGRKKQIIIRGGENISPLEIEEMIARHPAVKLAGVIGVLHPEEGEVPKAFVELKDQCHVKEAELKAFLEKQLIHYKVPEKIQFVENLPLLRTGKVDRQKLMDNNA